MLFNNTSTTQYSEIYATERSYTTEKSIPSNEFLPTVLSDLKQIVTYFTSNYKLPFKAASIYPCLMYSDLVDLHHITHTLCKNEDIIGNESKWDSFVDNQLEFLYQNAPTAKARLASTQLSKAKDLIKSFAYKENEAHENNETIFCRFDSNRGYLFNINHNKKQLYEMKVKPTKFSFGDSLLSGYIQDGLEYSQIEYGMGSSYGACTFSYWDIYRQAVEAKKIGYIELQDGSRISMESLPRNYKNYFDFSKHHLYTVSLTDDTIKQMIEDEQIYIPLSSTISSSACYQRGEEFHPLISLAGSNCDYSMKFEDLPLTL